MAIQYVDMVNGRDETSDNYGWWGATYNTGSGTRPADEDSFTNAAEDNGGITNYFPVETSGSWALGTAAGVFYFYGLYNPGGTETGIANGTYTFSNGATVNVTASQVQSKYTIAACTLGEGSEVRVAETDAPVSLGTTLAFTNNSRVVTLGAAKTQTIDNCETAWTSASADVTVARITISTGGKQGSYSMRFTLDSTPQASIKQAYRTITSIDLSAYQVLSFWIKNSAALADRNWAIKLCSDTAGNTVVDEFRIPEITQTALWHSQVILKYGGGNMGSSIQSIALYTDTTAPVASSNIILDNIIACTTNGLNLQSLIGFSSILGSNYSWYPIQSIDGTTIYLEAGNPQNNSNVGKAFMETSTTANGYFISGKKAKMAASTTVLETLSIDASVGEPTTITGGWNKATNVRNRDTVLDGLIGNGYAMSITGNWGVIRGFTFVRFNRGFTIGGNHHIIGHIGGIGNASYGIYLNALYNSYIESIVNLFFNGGTGLMFSNSYGNIVGGIWKAHSNNTQGVLFSASSNNIIRALVANGNLYALSHTNPCYNNLIKLLQSSGNLTGVIQMPYGKTNIEVAITDESTKVASITGGAGARVGFNSLDGVPTTIGDGFTLIAQNATSPNTGKEWKLSITSVLANRLAPILVSLGRFAVKSEVIYNLSLTVKLSHATNILGGITIDPNLYNGLESSNAVSEDNGFYMFPATATTDSQTVVADFMTYEDIIIEVFFAAWSLGSTSDYITFDNLTLEEA